MRGRGIRHLPASLKLGVALTLGLLVGLGLLLLPVRLPWTLHVLAGWCAVTLTYLIEVWHFVRHADAEETRAWATREDDSRATADFLILFGGTASLVGTGFALSDSQRLEQQGHAVLSTALTAVALLSVVLSWFLIHTLYTLHYARLYYNDPVGGVDFPHDDGDPEGQDPNYRDFAYLAFTVGMTYQVSDTDITHKRFRRRLAGHALLSFLFGTVIVAFSINVVAGLIK